MDPRLVTDEAARTAMLSSFNGLDPNGPWTLFIADNSALGTGTLAGWGLTMTADGVPETSATFGLLTLALGSLWLSIRIGPAVDEQRSTTDWRMAEKARWRGGI